MGEEDTVRRKHGPHFYTMTPDQLIQTRRKRPGTLADRIRHLFHNVGDELTVAQIVASLPEVPDGGVRSAISTLSRDHWLERPRYGVVRRAR